MFEHCRAFIVAADRRQGRILELTARELGFGEIVDSATGAPTHTAAEITFFLLDHRLSADMLHDVVETVRSHVRETLRYSPVILVADSAVTDAKSEFGRFGFDDIISLPMRRDALWGQLATHLNTDKIYYETNDYFGPDRRCRDTVSSLRADFSPYTRVIFRRDVFRGVRIVSREPRGQRFRPRPSPVVYLMPRLLGHAAH